MTEFLNWILARAVERSTWLGVIGMLSALGVTLSPALADSITAAGLALAGLVAAITADQSS